MSSDDRIGPRDLLLLLEADELMKRDGMEPVRKVFDSMLQTIQMSHDVLSQIANGADEPEKLAREFITRLGG